MISARKRARGRLEDGAANPVDAYVGNRIRLRRLMLNLSQKKLALIIVLILMKYILPEPLMNMQPDFLSMSGFIHHFLKF